MRVSFRNWTTKYSGHHGDENKNVNNALGLTNEQTTRSMVIFIPIIFNRSTTLAKQKETQGLPPFREHFNELCSTSEDLPLNNQRWNHHRHYCDRLYQHNLCYFPQLDQSILKSKERMGRNHLHVRHIATKGEGASVAHHDVTLVVKKGGEVQFVQIY